jgi:NifU-like protein
MNGPCTGTCDSCPNGTRVVCRCLNVTEDAIVTFIETLGLRTVHEVRQFTGAGDGCTCCHAQIREMIAERVPQLAAAG